MSVRIRPLLGIALSIITIAACSSSGGATVKVKGPDGSVVPQKPVHGLLVGPASPIPITIGADDTKTASQTVDDQGATLTATGADGSTYVLTIPKEALSVPTPIAMTPLSSIKGIPWGDDGAVGVQLTPDGQRFGADVTLVVTPATPIPDDHTIAFGLDGEQHNLTLAAVDPTSKTLTIVLHHFSSYGLSKGLTADYSELAQRFGGTDEARLESMRAGMLQRDRPKQLVGAAGTEFAENFDSYVKEMQEKVIKPRLEHAGDSCAAGRLAIDTVLSLERELQLLQASDGSTILKLVSDTVPTVALKCMQEEYEICRDQHIVHRIIGVYLGIARQRQLIGTFEQGAELDQKLQAYVTKCLTFRLDFSSTGTLKDPDISSIVSAKVPMKVDIFASKIAGTSALRNDDFQMSFPDCTVTPQRGGGTMEVSGLQFDVAFDGPTDLVGHVKDVKLSYYPGVTKEAATLSCQGVTVPFPPSPIWTGIFIVGHFDELDLTGSTGTPVKKEELIKGLGGLGSGDGGTGLQDFGTRGPGFLANHWKILGKDLFATLNWQLEPPGTGVKVTEEGSLKLFHTPG